MQVEQLKNRRGWEDGPAAKVFSSYGCEVQPGGVAGLGHEGYSLRKTPQGCSQPSASFRPISTFLLALPSVWWHPADSQLTWYFGPPLLPSPAKQELL